MAQSLSRVIVHIVFSTFGWQAGYGVFSVRRSRLPELVAYIRDQEEHQRRRNGVQFDEQWLWN